MNIQSSNCNADLPDKEHKDKKDASFYYLFNKSILSVKDRKYAKCKSM